MEPSGPNVAERPVDSVAERPVGAGPPRAVRIPAQRGARVVPVRSPQHEHLSLDALRDYRQALQDEENKVSYWRRILQARLDLVRADGPGGTAGGSGALGADRLRPVLTDAKVRAGRTALVQVLPVDDIPPLPSLGELWERCVDRDDTAGQARLDRELAEAEAQLSAYRSVLHRRLEEATGELIARYREQPGLCLGVLPLTPLVAPRLPPDDVVRDRGPRSAA